MSWFTRLFTAKAVPVATITAEPVQAAAAAPAPLVPSTKETTAGVSTSLARILRPQAAYRWLLPQLAAITPQYIEMVLRGALAGNHVQQWELFSLMEDTWPRLSKNLQQLKNGVRLMRPVFEPYADEGEEPSDTATERAQLCAAALKAMRPDPAADENASEGTVFDVLDAWAKGMSVLEIDWQRAHTPKLGPFIAPRCTYWVHPVCYAWSMQGRIGLRVDAKGQLSPGTISTTSAQPMPSAVGEFPADKFLIGISKSTSATALGGPRLRALAWWWCAANFSADWLLNLAQTFGVPFRWANYDPNAPQATVDAICSMLQNMGHSGWAAFPAGTTLELKNEGMKSGADTPQGDMLERADKNCDLLILGQTLTSDTGGGGKGGGSLALGKVHEGVRADIIEACAAFAASIYNEQLFPSILRLNYGDDSECPRVRFESVKGEDLVQKAAIVQQLVTAGFGDRIGKDWLGKTFGIPKPQDDEETLGTHEEPDGDELPNGKEPNGTDNPDAAADKAREEAMQKAVKALEASVQDDALFTKRLGELAQAL